LATGTYIYDKLNIIIMGSSGAGKTYLACAFCIVACRNFYLVKYIRLPELLNELAVARGGGIFQRVMKSYKKVPLLILDEWLLVSLKESEARDLLEIVEAIKTGPPYSAHSSLLPAGMEKLVKAHWQMRFSTESYIHPTRSQLKVWTPCVSAKDSSNNRSYFYGSYRLLVAPTTGEVAHFSQRTGSLITGMMALFHRNIHL
jgi:hypothetical protein